MNTNAAMNETNKMPVANGALAWDAIPSGPEPPVLDAPPDAPPCRESDVGSAFDDPVVDVDAAFAAFDLALIDSIAALTSHPAASGSESSSFCEELLSVESPAISSPSMISLATSFELRPDCERTTRLGEAPGAVGAAMLSTCVTPLLTTVTGEPPGSSV